MIKLFDSVTHPTINKNWLNPKYNGSCDIDSLFLEMQRYGVAKAFAVGMQGIGEYEEEKFIKLIEKYRGILYPVAYFDLKYKDNLERYIVNLKTMGYCGIKIHPRFLGINFSNPLLPMIVKLANAYSLVPMVCTYFSDFSLNIRDNLRDIADMMNESAESKIIFLHSGVTNLLEFVNMMKIYKGVLFDLSYTLCKYKGSSLDMDIRFLFEHFDKRICVGSDHPEVSIKEFRERFDFFSVGISSDKLENIAYNNLDNILKF